MMKKLPLFTRTLADDQEPTNHQRQFLFLPLPIFRNYTNVTSIIVEHHKKKYKRPPPMFVLNNTIKNYHTNLSQLNKWQSWDLNNLKFIDSPSGDTIEAAIWSEPEDRQQLIHRTLTDHQRQFVYLPLHIIKQATNIKDLLRPKTNGREKQLNFAVHEVFKQFASKRSRWLPELKDNLSFVIDDIDGENAELIDEQTSANIHKITEVAVSKTVDPEPKPSTSKSKKIIRTPQKNPTLSNINTTPVSSGPMMKKLPLFTRTLTDDQEPTNHQRQFLFLPLPIFRNYTNVISIIVERHKKKFKRSPPMFVLNNTIKNCHTNLSQLNKWQSWNLNNLKFIDSPSGDTIEAAIWSEPEERQQEIHRTLTDHQRQFVYLPLHIIKQATNIKDLLRPKTNGREKQLNFVVHEVFKQFASKRCHWLPELKDNLSFVIDDIDGENAELIDEQTSANIHKITEVAVSKTVDPEPKPSTSKSPQIIRTPQKNPPLSNINTTPVSSDRESRKRKIDSNFEEIPSKKSNETSKNQSDSDQNRKSRQSTLPTWLNNMSKPKIKQTDLGLGKLPKMSKLMQKKTLPQSPQKETIVLSHQSNENLLSLPTETAQTKANNNDTNNIVVNATQENEYTNTSSEKTHPSAAESFVFHREINSEDRQMLRESFTPSEFQKEILKLTFEEFKTLTNIEDIIQNDYRKQKQNENEYLTEPAMHSRLEYYYEFRKRTGEWHKNSIKNLKFKDCECKRKKNEREILNQSSKSQSKCEPHMEPSEFQNEVNALDFASFVNETNIKDLVIQELHRQFKGTREISEADIDFILAQYDRYRKKTNKWQQNSLKYLKFKKCDCKRKKKFGEMCTQTDQTGMQNVEVQCCANEFPIELMEVVEENQLQQSFDENQVIHILYVSNSDDANQATQGTQALKQKTNSNISVLPSQVTQQSHTTTDTYYSSSQSVSGSSRNNALVVYTAAESQQVMSVDEVRMSEFIESCPPANTLSVVGIQARNPLETQATSESIAVTQGEVSVLQEYNNELPSQSAHPSQTSQPSQSKFVPSENSTPNSSSVKTNSKQNSDKNADDETMIKVEPIFIQLSQPNDSDIVCLGEAPIEIFDISDEPGTQELFEMNLERDVAQIVTVETQPNVSQENVPEITTQNELISISAAPESPVIEDSESPPRNSPFRNIENIRQPITRQMSKEITEKRRSTVAVGRQQQVRMRSKKQKSSNDDSLSNIPIPKYTYGPLDFIVRQNVGNDNNPAPKENWNEPFPKSYQIVQLMQSPETQPNYSIEDSSTDEANHSESNMDRDGIVSDSCIERANLLNQDNSLFFNVNTQPNNSRASTTNPIAQPSQSVTVNTLNEFVTKSNAIESTNEQSDAVLLQNPGPPILSTLNCDRTEFLHYIDIIKIVSNFKTIITDSGNRDRQLEIETTLQHQCNASNRIIVKTDALKSIMNLTDKEWDAVLSTLSCIETFQYESKNNQPFDASVFHRLLYYLFKTASKISNVHITYGDQDLETARVIYKQIDNSRENITLAIHPSILKKMEEMKRNTF